jgi:hypothetical protein
MCEKHKASTNQTPKPQDTDISRSRALHQGMQALQAEKRWGVDSILFLWALTAWCVSIFQRRPGGYAAKQKRAKNNSAYRCKTRKTQPYLPQELKLN